MIRRRKLERRQGAIAMLALFAVPLFLLVLGLVVYLAVLRDARQECQSAADAAALACAYELASDELLTQDMDRAEQRLQRARNKALELASLNFSAGNRLQLDPNTECDPEGDVVFGRVPSHGSGVFTPMDAKPASWVGDRINAVQITPRRQAIAAPFGGPAPDRPVMARSLAMLDWEVVGFRPFNNEPVPMVPIAVFTDHIGKARNSWDAHCRVVKNDHLRFDHEKRQFVPGNDGIPEVKATIGRTMQGGATVPAMFLDIGTTTIAETIEQVSRGITRDEMEQKFTGGFVLGADNILPVPCIFGCPGHGMASRKLLNEAFDALIESGQPRIWPLFTTVDEDKGKAILTGWISARLASASMNAVGGIDLVLQPAVMHHPAIVAEHRSTAPLFWANNRTVCRVRLTQ